MRRRTVRPAGAVAAGASPAGRSPNGGPMPPMSGGGKWSPTVANLLILIVLEIVAFGAIRYLFHRISD